MRENIASVKAQTPVLGKLARMRQMQGKASRLDLGLAAFSERIAKRVTKRAVGQWRRFSLEYIMDEETEAQAPQRGDIYNNVDLDVLISLRAGEDRQSAEREILQQRMESVIERRLMRLQPETFLRKYNIHAPSHMQMHEHPVHTRELYAVRAADRSDGRPAQNAQRAPEGTVVLIERALLKERERTHTLQPSSAETIRLYVKENNLISAKQAEAQVNQAAAVQREPVQVPVHSMSRVEKTNMLRIMGGMQQKETKHIVREPVERTEIRSFAQTQMVQALGDVYVNEITAMRRAGDVVRQMQVVNRPVHSGMHQGLEPPRYAERLLAPGEKVRQAAQRMSAEALPAKETENERLAQQIRMRSRLGYEQLVHAESGAAQQGETESVLPQQSMQPASHRQSAQRAAVLWNVLERTTERLLSSVTRISALPGKEARSTAAVEQRMRMERPQERLLPTRSAQNMDMLRETEILRQQEQYAVQQNAIRETEREILRENESLRERELHTEREHRAQVLRQVLERSTEHMQQGAERMTETAERPEETRSAQSGATQAQQTLLRQIEQRNQFGYETLVHETGAQNTETLRETVETAQRETINETEREILHQQELRTEREHRAQVLRQVLERSAEHMLHSAERMTETAERSAETRSAQNGATQAQQTLLRQIEQRNRFGYETLVHETGTQGVQVPDAAQSDAQRETERELLRETERIRERELHTEREHRAQVLRQVLERSAEHMLHSVERMTETTESASTAGSAPAGERVRNIGDIRNAGRTGQRMDAQQTLLKQIEQRNQFGYETLVHETGAQNSETLRETLETERSETIRETERERLHRQELLREYESRIERERRAQVLRQVLERSAEHMLHSVERLTASAEPYAEPRASQSSATHAQQTLLKQIEQRNRFGYETLVHDMGAQYAELTDAVQQETITERGIVHENERIRERALHSQVLRQVLERSAEHMLRSTERMLPGRDGQSGAAGLNGAQGTTGRSGMAGEPGRSGRNGLDGASGIARSTVDRYAVSMVRNAYGQAAQPVSEKERLMRQIELRAQFGYETLVYENADSTQPGGQEILQPPAAQQTERVIRSDVQRMQVIRSVLERTTERLMSSVQRMGLAAAIPAADTQAAGRRPGGAAVRINERQGAVQGMQTGRPMQDGAMVRSIYGAQTEPQDALQQQIMLRRRFGYEELSYAADPAQPAGQTTVRPESHTLPRQSIQPGAQTIRNVMQRAVQAAARREAMLKRPATFETMHSVMQPPKTYARPLKTAVEGQVGMTMLMKQKNAPAQRSTLEMIAMAGEGTSPLRSSILTQPAEIVMFVPPTTMSMYGAVPPKVGNLSWDEKPAAEDRGSAQAALRLMQKAQQKFGSAARYRPPEMVMKEQGDATGKLASQQMGQPSNINQQMRARKTVVKESSSQELTQAEITRIVDRVYDKIEKKIATEYRRRGR